MKEALKLALEALLWANNEINEWMNDAYGYEPKDHLEIMSAITAIKEALAQPEGCQCPECQIKPHTSDCAVHNEPAYLKGRCDCGAQPEQKPVACVYKATTKKGEIAHFGEYSAAKAWAGWGTVEQVPLKTLTIIQKSIQPCSTCEALSRAVMLDQTAHDNFKPDWDTQAVLVEEMQRMAKRIEDLEAMLELQTARIVDLQTHIENLTGEE